MNKNWCIRKRNLFALDFRGKYPWERKRHKTSKRHKAQRSMKT